MQHSPLSDQPSTPNEEPIISDIDKEHMLASLSQHTDRLTLSTKYHDDIITVLIAQRFFPENKRLSDCQARHEQFKAEVMSGEWDALLPNSPERLAAQAMRDPALAASLMSKTLSFASKETGLLNEFSRNSSVEVIISNLSLVSNNADTVKNLDNEVLLAEFQSFVSGDFYGSFQAAHAIFANGGQPSSVESRIKLAARLIKLTAITYGIISKEWGLCLGAYVGSHLAERSMYETVTPPRSLRIATALESSYQLAAEMGAGHSLGDLMLANTRKMGRAIMSLRALRLVGELPNYIDNIINETSCKAGRYTNLEAAFVEAKNDSEAESFHDFGKLIDGLHSAQNIAGFHDQQRVTRHLLELCLANESSSK